MADITGGPQDDGLTGGAGDDLIQGLGGDDVLQGLGGDDRLFGAAGADRLFGGDGDDLLSAGRSNGLDSATEIDILRGEAGNDILSLTSTDFISGEGKLYDGGDDRDLLRLSDSAPQSQFNNATLLIDLVAETVRVSSVADSTRVILNIEDLDIQIADFRTSIITGDGVANAITASDGDDIIRGGGGADVIRARGGSNRVNGDAGDDTLFSESADDRLDGGAGDDTLIFLGGNLGEIDGGDGTDALQVSGVALDLSPLDFGQAGGAAPTSLPLENIERIELSGGASLRIDVHAAARLTENGALQISGGAGDALAFADDNWVEAPAENGSRRFENDFGAGVAVLLVTGEVAVSNFSPKSPFEIEGDGGRDVIVGGEAGEAIAGNGGNDTIEGRGGDDVIFGGDGSDILHGGDGDDVLNGGAGDDDLAGLDGIDRIDYSDSPGAVTVSLLEQRAQDGFGGTDRLSRVEQVTGSNHNDTLTGDAGDNLLQGLRGDDDIDGGAGDDVSDYSDAAGRVIASLALRTAADGDGGTDSLANIEGLIGGAANDVLTGDGRDNLLVGGDGDDRLTGQAGSDLMQGGAGDDIYAVQDLGDQVVEAAGEGRDRINVFVDFENPENVEFLVGAFASRGLQLSGNDGRESIAGANRISTGDVISGNGGNDRIVGLVGNDEIDGGAGRDRIFGNSGHDVIAGGEGNDRLTGQFGNDRFVHSPGDGNDRITDFDVNGDLLDFSAHGLGNFAAVQALMQDVAGGLLIDLAGPDSVLLEGLSAATPGLGAEDFILA